MGTRMLPEETRITSDDEYCRRTGDLPIRGPARSLRPTLGSDRNAEEPSLKPPEEPRLTGDKELVRWIR